MVDIREGKGEGEKGGRGLGTYLHNVPLRIVAKRHKVAP